MTFQSIAPIKPKRKNQITFMKSGRIFEDATTNCFTRSSRKVKNGTSSRK